MPPDAGYTPCHPSQLRSESSTRKCQWCEDLDWKVSLPERSEFTLFLGCETLPMSFALSELPSASPISETGKQKQKNGCSGGRLVAVINWQYMALSSCIVKVGCPPERSTCGRFCNNFVVTYSVLLGSHNNTDET